MKSRVRTIIVRHPTPSRKAIALVVSQLQDAKGNWLAPTILFNGPMSPIVESGRYARDVGMALIVAAFYYDLMLRFVTSDKAAEDLLKDDENGESKVT
ncbi:MAG: hypothetical protein L0287_02935 [Anaerolineae bacterium]|nr:hypothetical protein [Anaerolineae bacterium]